MFWVQTHSIRPCLATFDASLVKLWSSLYFDLLTTKNQCIFSVKKVVLKSCIGEGHPSPFMVLFPRVVAQKGDMHACLVFASFQNFLGVFSSCGISIFGRICASLYACNTCFVLLHFA